MQYIKTSYFWNCFSSTVNVSGTQPPELGHGTITRVGKLHILGCALPDKQALGGLLPMLFIGPGRQTLWCEHLRWKSGVTPHRRFWVATWSSDSPSGEPEFQSHLLPLLTLWHSAIFNLSTPHPPHLWNVGNSTSPTRLLCRLNELMSLKS